MEVSTPRSIKFDALMADKRQHLLSAVVRSKDRLVLLASMGGTNAVSKIVLMATSISQFVTDVRVRASAWILGLARSHITKHTSSG